MTLNLLIATPTGLWLSSDFRLSDRIGNRWVPRKDHWSPKYFTVEAPGEARMAITYTGVGEVSVIEPDLQRILGPDAGALQPGPGKRRTVSVTEWLSWILTGETWGIEEMIDYIGAEAAKLHEFRVTPHIFTAIVHTSYDGCWVVQLANLDVRPGEEGGYRFKPRCFSRRPLSQFHPQWVQIRDASSSGFVAVGSGASSLREGDFNQLRQAARIQPRNPKDYEGLLAKINRRVAGRNATVSPACQTLYLNPNFKKESNESVFGVQLWENEQKVPDDFDRSVMWTNLFGFDLSLPMRAFMKMAKKAEEENQKGSGSKE